MRESRTYGFVRGALSNGRPYRVQCYLLRLLTAGYGIDRRLRDGCLTVAIWGKPDQICSD
jgi:hypothetical protein